MNTKFLQCAICFSVVASIFLGCTKEECSGHSDCAGGGMCVAGSCVSQKESNRTAGGNAPGGGGGGVSAVETTDDETDSTLIETDHYDSETETESDFIIEIDSDEDTVWGCIYNDKRFSLCVDYDETDTAAIEVLNCDHVAQHGCIYEDDCLGGCDIPIADSDTATLDPSYSTLYYLAIDGAYASTFQASCINEGGEWQLCE